MQSPPPRPTKSRRARDPVRDGLVVISMTVVALALGIGLHLQFALAFWLAVVAALSVYVALLSTHVLVRRAEYVDELRREVARLESGKPRPGELGILPSGAPGAYQPPMGPMPRHPSPMPANGPQSPEGAMKEFWQVAPSGFGQSDATVPPTEPRPQSAVSASAHVPERSSSQQRDADAEQINAVIKKIAADITNGQAALDRAGLAAAAPAAVVPPTLADDIGESVAALHAAADAMRQVDRSAEAVRVDPDFQPSRPGRRPTLPPPLPVDRGSEAARERLAAVAAALEGERFDVLLEPIMGLGDRRAQHYVVSVRMRDGMDEALIGTGSDRTAPGSGLLPLLDAVKVERAARVVWRMEDRGKSGALFSQLSGESLVSDRFLNRFADTYRQGDALSGRLVLSFRQAELRRFSELQWATLRDMADLGFRFCLEDVTSLDQDFAELVASGFTFARLDAGVFLDGLPTEHDMIPAADICRHFAGLGLMVIVSGIADEAVSDMLRGYGVELGQGGLFGAPRPVKADVLRNPHAAVA